MTSCSVVENNKKFKRWSFRLRDSSKQLLLDIFDELLNPSRDDTRWVFIANIVIPTLWEEIAVERLSYFLTFKTISIPVSKVFRCCTGLSLLRYVIGLKESRTTLSINQMPKPIATLSWTFSRTLSCLLVFSWVLMGPFENWNGLKTWFRSDSLKKYYYRYFYHYCYSLKKRKNEKEKKNTNNNNLKFDMSFYFDFSGVKTNSPQFLKRLHFPWCMVCPAQTRMVHPFRVNALQWKALDDRLLNWTG